MSIDRYYRCDLCNASVPKESLDKFLIGLYWIDHPHGWTQRDARSVEHHICQTCLNSLVRLAEQIAASDPQPGDVEIVDQP
jgi:hypothetical protein